MHEKEQKKSGQEHLVTFFFYIVSNVLNIPLGEKKAEAK